MTTWVQRVGLLEGIELRRAGRRGVYEVRIEGRFLGYVMRIHTLGWHYATDPDTPEGPTYHSPREAARALEQARGRQ